MKKLTSNISSGYMAAANALRSQKERRKIVAYVESYDDVLFWRTVLSQFENENRYFEVMLPMRGSDGKKVLGRGKKSAVRCIMENTGKDMIACVDADYDYLLQGHTEHSRLMLDTPYVFHTYAYAIENLQCYAPNLHNVCVMATLNDHRIFDFETFLRLYSEAIWPLFVWSIALYRNDLYTEMSIGDMDQIISTGKVSMENADDVLYKVRVKAQRKTNELRAAHPDLAAQMPSLKEELKALGVRPSTTYLFIHGHHLFDKTIVPLMKNVCNRLIREREKEIHTTSLHYTQMNNELSCYANSIQSIESMLKKSTGYLMAPVLRMVTSQLSAMLDGEE